MDKLSVPLPSTNRSLQNYGVQMDVCTSTVSKDVCTTTTTSSQRHLHHGVSNRFTCVALCLKSYLDPCNHAIRKSDKHTMPPSLFINTKVYLLQHFLVVVKKGETANEN